MLLSLLHHIHQSLVLVSTIPHAAVEEYNSLSLFEDVHHFTCIPNTKRLKTFETFKQNVTEFLETVDIFVLLKLKNKIIQIKLLFSSRIAAATNP